MSGFAYPNLFGKKVPAPAARWAGNAKFNFIGGHNDRTLIPVGNSPLGSTSAHAPFGRVCVMSQSNPEIMVKSASAAPAPWPSCAPPASASTGC